MSIRITDKLVLNNPVMNASGTFAYGEEFAEFFDLARLGAVITKGLSLNPKIGNPTPRIVETPCGLINAIGLENVGVEAFVSHKLPFLNSVGVPVIANFFGNSEDEYVACAERLSSAGLKALEMNVSCPNVKKGGIQFGTDPNVLHQLIKRVRAVTDAALIVKLSPLVTDIQRMALAAQEAGADALTCVNTFPAMAIDVESWRPVLGNITGGLSGPAIKPIALKLVFEVAKVIEIPIIASGGIMTANDVVEYLLAGASAVEVGSAGLRDPNCFIEIIEGLEDYRRRHKIDDLSDLTGAIRL